MKANFSFLWLSLCLLSFSAWSQEQPNEIKEMKLNLNADGSHYVKGTFLNQVWLRNTQLNPETTIDGYAKDNYTDISIRRLRFQILAQLTDRVFFYAQFGQNNLNYRIQKYTGAFFHDAIVEYAIIPKKISVGGGLTGWSGLTRFAAPSIGSNLALDAPLYQQATNGINDQFLRKLSIYAKGQLGKFDYRLALTSPMTITGAPSTATTPSKTSFDFSNEPAKMQLQGYFKYMFKDVESNLTPYTVGSYLGTKSVLNVGAGFIYQPDAMWALNGVGGTIHNDMVLLGADVFYDKPLSAHTALTAYGAFTNYDFGAGYLRNLGVNNPANGIAPGYPNAPGNAFPAIGTGNTFFGQLGYVFGKNILSEGGKLQPFASLQYSDYDMLRDKMRMYELGMNYLVNGTHTSKFSLVYQSRPTYNTIAGENVADARKGMTILQYQITF